MFFMTRANLAFLERELRIIIQAEFRATVKNVGLKAEGFKSLFID